MAQFFKLIDASDKGSALLEVTRAVKVGAAEPRAFDVDIDSLRSIPGSPFAYWLTARLRHIYKANKPFEDEGRSARQGLATTDDFRFLRAWWEVHADEVANKSWTQFARSGGVASYYGPSYIVIKWRNNGSELKALIIQRYGNAGKRIYNENFYFRSGFCWPLRGSRLTAKAVGSDSVFGIASKMAFAPTADKGAFLSILNSKAFDYMLKVQAGSTSGVQFESGLIAKTPVPSVNDDVRKELEAQSTEIWKRKWLLGSGSEISHAFCLPAAARSVEKNTYLSAEDLRAEIEILQNNIDEIVFDLYGMSESLTEKELSEISQL